MNKIEIQKIGIVGAGNLAWHIAAGINNSGLDLVGVYNRTSSKAEELAARLNTKVVTNFNAFRQCDLILLLVKDDAIREMAAQLQQSKAVIAHTSGNTSLEVLFPHQKTGVFYPLQTFSKDVAVNLNKVPILVEGSTDQIENGLYELASRLSKKVYKINSQQRRRLHVAAVFANNFANHMLKQAYDICEENDIPFEVLSPLIKETIEKIKTVTPAQAQTGPAVRHDEKTIKIHKDLLEGSHLELYELITKDIERTYK